MSGTSPTSEVGTQGTPPQTTWLVSLDRHGPGPHPHLQTIRRHTCISRGIPLSETLGPLQDPSPAEPTLMGAVPTEGRDGDRVQVRMWGAGEDMGCRQKMSPLSVQMVLESPKPSDGSTDTGQSHTLSNP